MNNDFESLSKAWQSQPLSSNFDRKELKKNLFFKRLGLLLTSLVELLIIAVVIWLLIDAFTQSRAIHLKVWFILALICGVIAMIVSIKSRFKSLKMLTSSTQSWIEFEQKMSHEVLRRVMVTRYLMLIFCIALTGLFIYEIIFLNYLMNELIPRYTFGILWLGIVWFINRHQMKKHQNFLNRLK
ncbi:hypothetical protein [Thalassotalea agariperforans]